MRKTAAVTVLSLGIALPALLGLSGCASPGRQAAEDEASADTASGPVGSMWWSLDVHACVFNETAAPIKINWTRRTSGDTMRTIAPGESSCASDGHSAFSTEHSWAKAQITMGSQTYYLSFENPPVWKPGIFIRKSEGGSIVAEGDGSEGWSADWVVDGHSFTAKRLNDSSDAKELELHVKS